MEKEYKKGYIKMLVLICGIVLYFLVSKYCFRVVVVSGNSMSDTVCDGAVCFVDSGKFTVERYDIVLAKMNYQTSIKRVIGLPNDTILIDNGVVFVNGKACEEYNYYTEKAGIAEQKIVLGDGEYFLLGDNRSISYDSREFGVMTKDRIVGVVKKILWKGR